MGFTLAPLPKIVVSNRIKKTEGKMNAFCNQSEKCERKRGFALRKQAGKFDLRDIKKTEGKSYVFFATHLKTIKNVWDSLWHLDSYFVVCVATH